MSVYNDVVAGNYKNKLEYPMRPIYPPVLRKQAKDLSTDELAVIHDVIKNYDDERLRYEEAVAAYGKETARLEHAFKVALEEENGVQDNPLKNNLFMKAWDYGHSAGLAEVANYYADLVELIRR